MKKLLLTLALISLSSFTYADTYTAEQLQSVATNLNKDYPTMVDKITKLTSVTLDASTFKYHYQLIDKSVSEIDQTKFNTLMRETLAKTVCSDKFANDVLNSNFNLSFDYIDKDGKPVADIIFKAGDCPKPTT